MELDESETRLKAQYDLSNDQLYWRRLAIADENGDVDKFNQEYPISVESAFLSTDHRYFDEESILKVQETVQSTSPLERYDIKATGIAPNEFGNTWEFERPEKSQEYVMGVDVAGGTEDDYTVISVFNPSGKLVCVLRDNQLRPDSVASAIMHIAKRYNNAKVCIERNGIGNFVIQSLQYQLHYPNLYYFTDGRAGFNTNEVSRKHILAQLAQFIVEGKVNITFPEMLNEMNTFELSPNGKPQAKKGYHDDCILGIALGVESFVRFRPGFIDIDEIEQSLPRRRFTV